MRPENKKKNKTKRKRRHHHRRKTYDKHDIDKDLLSYREEVRSSDSTRLNCHPRFRKQKNTTTTCFDDNVIHEMIRQYNAKHVGKNSIIDSMNPNILGKKMRDEGCIKEDCWVDKLIDDRRKGDKMKKDYLAPFYEDKWNDKDNAWLSNFDINAVMKQYEEIDHTFEFDPCTTIDFRKKLSDGNCVSNELCNFSLKEKIQRGKKKIATVINTTKHDKEGEHWFSIFINIEDKFLFFFDSSPPSRIPKQVKEFFDLIQKQGLELLPPIKFEIKSNVGNEHQMTSSECGMYSIFFIKTLLTNSSILHGGKQVTPDEILKMFLKEHIRDEIVKDLRLIDFNPKNKFFLKKSKMLMKK